MDLQDTLALRLRQPVTIGKGDAAITHETLELREPTAGELVKASAATSDVESNIVLISLVAGVPKPVVERIVSRDFQEAVRFLRNFTLPAATSDDTAGAR